MCGGDPWYHVRAPPLQPSVVSSHEESELQRMLADLELANQELSGDEDSDEDSDGEAAGGAGGGKGDADDERECATWQVDPGAVALARRQAGVACPTRTRRSPFCATLRVPTCAVDAAKRVGGVGDDELMGLAAAAAAGAGAGAAGAGKRAGTV